MTCKDCIHFGACVGDDDIEYATEEALKADCPNFKNKADFVEVVHCRDCKHYESCEGGKDYCWWNDSCVTENDFCSYGERKDT